MHRLAHARAPSKRERNVAQPSAHVHVRTALFDLPGGFEERDGIRVVLLDPGSHGEDVGVEDHVLEREAHLVTEHLGRPLTYGDLTLDGVCLALLVERHDDHCSSVAPRQASLFDERRLSGRSNFDRTWKSFLRSRTCR